MFLAVILSFFFENAVCYHFQNNQPIFLIVNSKLGKVFYVHVLKFEENRSKISTVRVPEPKTAKMAAMMSSILNFQNRRKTN